jgi:hypothetical protein
MGEERYSSTILDLDTIWNLLAPLPGRFIPGEEDSGTYYRGGWMGPRASLDVVE